MSFCSLYLKECNQILKSFISIIGIILLTPLYLPEQDKNVAEIV